MIQFFAGSLANPKVKQFDSEKAYFCCSALTTPDGDMYWPAAEPKSHTSAKVYTSLFVRHWDAWTTENQNSLWLGELLKKDGKWVLENGLTNLLAGTGLSSPVAPFGGTGDFDISATGVVFVAKDPKLNPARYTKSDLYYIPFQKGASSQLAPRMARTGSLRGYTMSPTFSRDGKKVVFLRMKSDQYESDRPRLMIISDISKLDHVGACFEGSFEGNENWESRLEWATWSNDGNELFVAAEKHGRVSLWKLAADGSVQQKPQPIFEGGGVIEAKVLGDSSCLLVSSKTRVENSRYAVLDPKDKSIKEISSSSKHGKSLGLSQSQCSEIWYEGAAGYPNHALVMTPSHFDKSKKYPLAMLIHGGPQSAWTDDWSTRWNPAIFAEQGYVVVCPNPTGSTGYGQSHVDAIKENWGGTPYQDLVKCFEYLEEELDYVDTDHAVALGASYGGYMISKFHHVYHSVGDG